MPPPGHGFLLRAAVSRNGTGGPSDCQRTRPATLRDTRAVRITADPPRPPRRPAGPAVRRRLGPAAAAARSRPRSSASRPTRASWASGPATRWTASRRSSTCSSDRTRWRSPGTSGRSRRSTSMPAGTGRSRSRCGTSSARSPVSRSRPSSAERPTAPGLRLVRVAAARRPSGPSRRSALRAEGFRALKIRVDPRPPRGRARGGRRDARRGRRFDGDHGRPQPGLADGGRHGGLARPGRAPARSRSGSPPTTCCGWRSRWPAPTCRPGRAASIGARHPHRRRRDDPHL